MTNPWLSIPLDDYEGHMNHPSVQQLRALSELFKHAVEHAAPEASPSSASRAATDWST
jgi:hypothetical protein